MEQNELIALARQQARLYQLDEALVCAVCEQESTWDPWAARPEPDFEKRYEEPLNISIQAKWLRSLSYGLMQIMGQTAREFGFTGKYDTQLCDPLTGLTYGCKKLKRCLFLSKGDVNKALLLYNGGKNEQYDDEVLARVPKYASIQQNTI